MLAERIRSLEDGPPGGRTEDGTARLSEHPSLPPTIVPAGDTTGAASATASRMHSSNGQQSVSSKEARAAGLLPAFAPQQQSGASGDSSDSNARAVDRAVKLVNRMLSGGKVCMGGGRQACEPHAVRRQGMYGGAVLFRQRLQYVISMGTPSTNADEPTTCTCMHTIRPPCRT